MLVLRYQRAAGARLDRRDIGRGNSSGEIDIVFAVGVIHRLTRARLDYLNAIAEYSKAQFALKKAIGSLQANDPTDAASSKPALRN